VPRTGRRPGSAGTRERVARAARDLFGERGFDATTIRAIAARAEVDPALVHHYFGSKERLFVAVMELPFDPSVAVTMLADGDLEGVGERIVRFALDTWDRPEARPVILGILRSAAADPGAARMLRELLISRFLAQFAAAVDRPNADLRVALAGSQIVGLAMARFIVGIEPIASADNATLARAVGPTVERYLLGDLGEPSDGWKPVPER
jgi:AcrR family transcriptional regulator